jgi:flagellar assembly protein FliH
LSEEETRESAKKSEFKISYEGQTDAPGFSAIYSTGEEEIEVAKDPVDTIEAQADQIRKEAYAKGFLEGQKVGEEGQKEKVREVLEALHTAMVELDSLKNTLHNDAERQAVEIGLMIARKIVCHEVSIDPETIFRVLGEALKKVSDQKEICVKIHPSDLQAINEAGFDVSGLVKSNGHMVLEAGDGICKGECVIETDFGFIDARMESQLQTIEESLRLMLQSGTMSV